MLIKFGLQNCVHIFININRNHLVNYIYQIFIDKQQNIDGKYATGLGNIFNLLCTF